MSEKKTRPRCIRIGDRMLNISEIATFGMDHGGGSSHGNVWATLWDGRKAKIDFSWEELRVALCGERVEGWEFIWKRISNDS